MGLRIHRANILRNMLSDGAVCVGCTNETEVRGPAVLVCTPVQKGGTHHFAEVFLCGFVVRLASITLFDDVASDPLPGMGDHDAFVVVAHVKFRKFLVHEGDHRSKEPDPVRVLHTSFDVLDHLCAIRNAVHNLVEDALSLFCGAVGVVHDEIVIAHDVITETLLIVSIASDILIRDDVDPFAVLVGHNHGFARFDCVFGFRWWCWCVIWKVG